MRDALRFHQDAALAVEERPVLPAQAAVEPARLRRPFADLDEILSIIPRHRLAARWEVCRDVGVREGCYPAYSDDPRKG